MPSILFICTANVCRSPMAMARLQSIVRNKHDWRIESAGTWAIEGMPVAEFTRLIADRWGIDLSQHRSRNVDEKLVEKFNLILTMEKNQKEALQLEFPAIAQKIFVISEVIGKNFDIQDPMGGSFEDFIKTSEEIEYILKTGLDHINNLLEIHEK